MDDNKALTDLGTAEVLALLDRCVPADARVVRGARSVALLWLADGTEGRDGRFLRVEPGGMTRAGELPEAELLALAPGTVDEALAHAARLDAGWLEGAVPGPSVPAGAGDPDRSGALASLAEGAHAPTLDAMSRNLLSRDATYAWLRAGGPAALAFADEHPWLVQACVSGPSREVSETLPEGPDAAAATALRALAGLGPAEAAELMGTLRHLAVPERLSVQADFGAVANVSLMPPHLLPPPVPVRSGTSTPADIDLMALHALGCWVPALARAAGRDVGSVLGKVGTWGDYLARAATRAGCPIDPSMAPNAWPWHVGHDLMDRVADMAAALVEQLVLPACLLSGVVVPRRPGAARHLSLHAMAADPVHAAALRLLAGRRTLPAILESTRAWHSGADATMRRIVEMADGAVPPGPRLFDRIDLGEGRHMVGLSTAADLLDEGSPGADANGAPGLDHCVGGFAEFVTNGSVAIVSLRRDLPGGGYERLSTAEVAFDEEGRWDVSQHQGRANAPVGRWDDAALARALEEHGPEAWRRLSAYREGGAATLDWPSAIAVSGTWHEVRDLWGVALTRPQRAMGPAELLREAGLPTLRHPRP